MKTKHLSQAHEEINRQQKYLERLKEKIEKMKGGSANVIHSLPGGTFMADVVGLLKEEKKVLQKRLSALEQAIGALSGEVAKDVKRAVKRGKKMSPLLRRNCQSQQKHAGQKSKRVRSSAAP